MKLFREPQIGLNVRKPHEIKLLKIMPLSVGKWMPCAADPVNCRQFLLDNIAEYAVYRLVMEHRAGTPARFLEEIGTCGLKLIFVSW